MSSGPSLPAFLYGTAWKEEHTASLVQQALRAGFRGLDSANQRKHYHEAGAAAGFAAHLRATGGRREDYFLQSKFTHRAGQDHRLPYDPRAPITLQVAQSFQSTLRHFDTGYLDSYLLHGPSARDRLAAEDWEAWRAMEALAQAGRAVHLGVSNVTAAQLAELLAGAELRPRFVQNRCYAERGWDREVRALCRQHGVVYQAFSLLTANPRVLADPEVRRLAAARGVEPAQIVFRFARLQGLLPLTGTSSALHLRQDLDSEALYLSPEEVARLEQLG